MIKWNEENGVVSVVYPNGMTVVIRHDTVTGYTDVDIYLKGENVSCKVYELMFGRKANLPFGFANVDSTLLTAILNKVSNIMIGGK